MAEVGRHLEGQLPVGAERGAHARQQVRGGRRPIAATRWRRRGRGPRRARSRCRPARTRARARRRVTACARAEHGRRGVDADRLLRPPSPRAGSWSGRRSRTRGRRRARPGPDGTASGDRRMAAGAPSGTARTGRGSTRRSESQSPLSCLVRSRAARRPRAARRAATRRLTWANGSRAAPAASTRAPSAGRDGGPDQGARAQPRPWPRRRRSTAASSTVSRLPRNVVQARPRRTTRGAARRAGPSRRWRSSG